MGEKMEKVRGNTSGVSQRDSERDRRRQTDGWTVKDRHTDRKRTGILVMIVFYMQ